MKTPPTQRHSILIVDDDDDFRELLLTTLSLEEFDVHEAASGAAARAAVKEHDYDLILLDIKMPGMDGLKVLKHLRKESPLSDFLMLTGFQDVDLAVESIRLGAKEFVSKQVHPSELVMRIKSTLRAHDAEAQLRSFQAQFTDRLLYELRTPLNSVQSTVAFLQKGLAGPVTAEQQTILNHIASSVEKMFSLVSDMIDLTKFESGRVELELFPVNLDNLIPVLCTRFEPRARAKRIALNLTIPPTIPTLQLDAGKIEQVMENLLDNALKYTADGGSVTVTTAVVQKERADLTREYVEISVADTGIGIPETELPFVFDKYKEVLTGKTSRHKTTGMGLAICRSIVEAHHGWILAESVSGRGSTIRFYLPVE